MLEPAPVKLACVIPGSPGSSLERTDCTLFDVATRLLEEGVRVCGVVQTNSERPGRRRCDMDLMVLPKRPEIRISQNLGENARGCRLDAAALEHATCLVEKALRGPVDLLIVNKFGKFEAEGRGFRSVFASALDRGIPVLTGVSALNIDAFDQFAGDLALRLPSRTETILEWCRGAAKGAVSSDAASMVRRQAA